MKQVITIQGMKQVITIEINTLVRLISYNCEEEGFQNLSTLRVKAENVEYIAGDKPAPLMLAAIFTVTSSREARGRGNDVIKRKRLSVFYRGIGALIVM